MADSIPSGSRGARARARARHLTDAKLLEDALLAEQQSQKQSPLLQTYPSSTNPPTPPPYPSRSRAQQPVLNIPAPPPLSPAGLARQPVPNIPASTPPPQSVPEPNIPAPPPLPPPGNSMRNRFRTVFVASPQPVPNIPASTPPPQPVLEPNIPAPPPLPPPGNSIRNRFRTVFVASPQPVHDIEANIRAPVEPAPIGNFFDRIRVIRNLFLIPNPNLLAPPTFIEVCFDRIRVSIRRFVRYLLKRTEEFRSEEEADEMNPRFLKFSSNSTLMNDRLWSFFKWVYLINIWLMILCLFVGACYWKFGEGASNPKSFRFKDKSMISPVFTVGFVSSIVYWCYVYHNWNESNLFKIRSYHIGVLALDVVCDVRLFKSVFLSYYGFLDPAKYGCWTDFFVVGFPVFFSIASLSILTLFKKEFYHADGLVNDFIIIFVSPCGIQLAHGAYINAFLYAIPIVFGRISKFVGVIYRPHVTDDYYDPTTTTGN